ncbi:MAG: C-terminal helicase domain-containing protein [Gaiellaceae bacterium]
MQRRLASSTRAIRRTLERRLERIDREVLGEDELEDLDEAARWEREEKALSEWLPATVAELEAEREPLEPLLPLAQRLDESKTERKLVELLDVVKTQGLREDRRKQLVIFTEHKDTLDYLVEQLRPEFDGSVIHGGLKLAERIEQERFFRERAQILVATEAAGEGINLQFCHLMVNYDIPWSPHRLEQRMGRIHRIGQEREVHVFNLVAGETREGYVLKALLDKLERIGVTLGDRVFDVSGGMYAEYNLRELLESVLAGEVSKEKAAQTIAAKEDDPTAIARAGAARVREHRMPPS